MITSVLTVEHVTAVDVASVQLALPGPPVTQVCARMHTYCNSFKNGFLTFPCVIYLL